MSWFDLLDKILGFGKIPPNWKQRITSLVLAIIAFVELWVDIPDEYATEVFAAKLATAIAVVIAFAMRVLRPKLSRNPSPPA